MSLPASLPGTADEEGLRNLDSSVKRNTGLIKRLRLISDETRQSLLDDIAKTKQTKVLKSACMLACMLHRI